MGRTFVAVIDRWLHYRGTNIHSHITLGLELGGCCYEVVVVMRWLLYRVTTVLRFHCSAIHLRVISLAQFAAEGDSLKASGGIFTAEREETTKVGFCGAMVYRFLA